MREIQYTDQLKWDLRLVKKRGKDLQKLKVIIEALQVGKPLPEKISQPNAVLNRIGY